MSNRIRILIADDQRAARRGLRALLTTWPHLEIVGEAADARQAVQQATKLRPDVVLMDIRMPQGGPGSGNLGGLHATRCIKQECPCIKIVMLTMYGSYQAEAFEAGAEAFLIKGVAPDQLVATLERLTSEEASKTDAV